MNIDSKKHVMHKLHCANLFLTICYKLITKISSVWESTVTIKLGIKENASSMLCKTWKSKTFIVRGLYLWLKK